MGVPDKAVMPLWSRGPHTVYPLLNLIFSLMFPSIKKLIRLFWVYRSHLYFKTIQMHKYGDFNFIIYCHLFDNEL